MSIFIEQNIFNTNRTFNSISYIRFMNSFNFYLHQLNLFNHDDILLFEKLFSLKTFTKNTYFAKEGEFSNKFAFVSKGILRAFYRNTDGVEYNKTFFTENHFVGAYSSLITSNKNLINIECLTDCEMYVSNYFEMKKLYDTNPKIERFARLLAEKYFVLKEKREIELVMLNASERYQIFKKEHQNVDKSVPLYHIASYLGISATQLSRIRAQK